MLPGLVLSAAAFQRRTLLSPLSCGAALLVNLKQTGTQMELFASPDVLACAVHPHVQGQHVQGQAPLYHWIDLSSYSITYSLEADLMGKSARPCPDAYLWRMRPGHLHSLIFR